MSDPFALISPNRSVFIGDADGTIHNPGLDGAGEIRWGSWNVTSTHSAKFSWPTWSPDGRWVGVFRLPSEQSQSRLFAIEAGGVRSTEIGKLPDRIPIYLQWSPDGRRMAVLCQSGRELQLSAFDTEQLGREVSLAKGTPLFFTWANDRVLGFVGSDSGATQLELFDPRMVGHSTVLPGIPGNFCAPLWMQERAVYVLHHRGDPYLATAKVGDSEPTLLEPADGLVAMLGSPDGKWIARATAPDGDGTPYQDLGLVHVETGEVRPLGPHPCLAFFWTPSGDALITARVDTDRNLIVWSRVELDGSAHPFASLYPTRDLGFYLRFFEQYAQSHRLVSSDGKHMLLSGGLDDAAEPDRSRIWRVATDGSGAEEVTEGLFAVYGPAR
ncbi:MAG: PD40 domain-containing protein [Proteobacteria bacterium]|nr:PD40 domain-containing protein [Pseudomonadota bacterium]